MKARGVEILQTGMLTTLQDAGRTGYRALGVPLSGALDDRSFAIANALLENPENTACLEMTGIGGQFLFHEDVVLSVTGADMSPVDAKGHPIPMWSAFKVNAGERVIFSTAKTGMRTYLAVKGGFRCAPLLGSCATYTRGKIYPLFHRPLAKGDVLMLEAPESQATDFGYYLPVANRPVFEEQLKLRVVMGPDEAAFTEESLQQFLTGRYTVTPASDRMGCRLSGPSLVHTTGADVISGGIVPGAIQIPGDGMPIVLMKDAQTTGGYTKVAHVIGADLWKMAQAKPETQVTFEAVSVELAHEAYRQQTACIEQTFERLDLGAASHYAVRVDGKAFKLTLTRREEADNDS
ncbi:5-oxoprolinase subunit C family protein [Fusibacter sp. JL298sf-3]